MVGAVAGPLNAAVNEADTLTVAGSDDAALNLTVAEGLWVGEAGAGAGAAAAALTEHGDLFWANTGSGEGVGGMGEEVGLSAVMDARGGKERRERC